MDYVPTIESIVKENPGITANGIEKNIMGNYKPSSRMIAKLIDKIPTIKREHRTGFRDDWKKASAYYYDGGSPAP